MDVVVSLEHHFVCAPDLTVWTKTAFTQSFWNRYLNIFSNVRIVSRIRSVKRIPPGFQRVDGSRILFHAVPDYLGPLQYSRKAFRVAKHVKSAVGDNDAVIMRVGSQLAACLIPGLIKSGHPYGLEVVGDPGDVFAPGSLKHPLRPFFRWWFVRQLKRQCANACAVAYVTTEALQHRYPAGTKALTTDYSDVELPEIAFAGSPRSFRETIKSRHIVTVGSLAQLYKAPDVLIDAFGAAVKNGLNLRLTLIGDGKHRPELEARVAAHKLADRVAFLGDIPYGRPVREHLDKADLFVLPSRTDSMPRALLEAMARGLPCIGSTVGGIPELLSSEDMVAPGDAVALCRKIGHVLKDPQRMAEMSVRNLAKAREFREEILRPKQAAFYKFVKDRTKTWITARSRP